MELAEAWTLLIEAAVCPFLLPASPTLNGNTVGQRTAESKKVQLKGVSTFVQPDLRPQAPNSHTISHTEKSQPEGLRACPIAARYLPLGLTPSDLTVTR